MADVDLAAGLRARDRDVVRLVLRHPALEHVHRADEVGDEARARVLVDLRRLAHLHDDCPAFITPMRVESVIASSWSWVTTMKVTPSVSWILISSNWVSSRSFLSSAPSGSSSSRSFGRLTRLRASATRCRCPPESWCGLRRASSLELDQPQDVGDPVAHLLALHPVAVQPVGDVLLHRHVREERVGLEHHVGRPLVGRQPGHVLPVDLDPPARRRLEAREHPQQRRLAAARAAEQAEELALPDVEADTSSTA